MFVYVLNFVSSSPIEFYLDLPKSCHDLDRDSEVNWRHDISSNIIYTYIRKGAMLNKFYVTSLSTNEFLSNRFLITKNEFKTYFSGRELIQLVQKQHVQNFTASYADLNT